MADKISFELQQQKRLIGRLQGLTPTDPRFKEALFNMGNDIVNRAKDNVTKQKAVSSGLLRSSIRFDIRSSKSISVLNVGVYGLPYARLVEYGGPFTDRMRRAMFAKFKEMGAPKKEAKKPRVIRAGYYRKRMYLTPAITDSIAGMDKLLSDILKDKK